MIVVMRPGTTEQDVEEIVARLGQWGLKAHVSRGTERTVIGVIGERTEEVVRLASLQTVEQVVPVRRPYKLVSREFHPENTVIRVGRAAFGTGEVVMMPGPCAVESREQVMAVAELARDLGCPVLRGGAYKPRTSPYSFQGLGVEGLRILAEARERYGLAIITEAVDHESLKYVAEYADIVQIGTRNMQNFELLKAVGQIGRPVLLKRGMAATIDEWLMAAEYVAAHGNPDIILCERGIRTYEPKTRNTLDLSAVPVLKQLTHLPVVVDPSHATGQWSLVEPMALAAVAAGADGLLIEAHPNPAEALSDGPQSLNLPNLTHLVENVSRVAAALGRRL
ncbi:Phospho-2-dehydro-3-deoxyheptonate aldolase [Candidatus Hydrogenisulfobacillus filiaventi]|uniref:Phospho-2-dehydro-3-deoxyheptonate aldolase n=1 Tax=Candidatus Hydrogenisulfobacillus filiaventi TaxID=2707344 RepID=A0A6F8ZGU1_9FIRM|nr:Phospho-2-dehydro-3-deoxyheptonate aldolase [Candidatus Hydrogenisulfobacillus filiaventi]